VKIFYNSRDISEDISNDLISLNWTDKASKESDDLAIKLHNAHGLWCGDWQPAKGATLTASICVENWNGNEGMTELPCGIFEIDETALSGPPSVVDIKAISVPVTSKIRGQARTHAWDNVRLSEIAGDIAKQAGLSLVFDLTKDPIYQREDQLEETDLSFLLGLAEEAGASLKVSHGRLILFDEKEYEKKPSAVTLNVTDLVQWQLQNKSSGVYGSCRVKYHDPEMDEDIEYEEEADLADLNDEDRNERVLSLNWRCKDLAEAEEKARNMLHDANKYEVSGSITLPGNMQVVAGINIELTGLGRYSGKYVVESSTHAVSRGYITTAEIRRGGKKNQKSSNGDWDEFDLLGDVT
jgi:phage protein D